MPITINGSGTITGVNVGGLPDGIVDTDMIATGAVTSAKSSGLGGLPVAEGWQLTANKAGANFYFGDSDVALSSTKGAGSLNAGMTNTSGVWTFPSTGYWLIQAKGYMSSSNLTQQYCFCGIYTDAASAGTYEDTTLLIGSGNTLGSGYAVAAADALIDVTDTSTVAVKIMFAAQQAAQATWTGGADSRGVYVNFFKLGDT